MNNVDNKASDNDLFRWYCTIEDAEDGSGDGILTLPPALCDLKGWKEGTVLHMKVEHGALLISDSPFDDVLQENNTTQNSLDTDVK